MAIWPMEQRNATCSLSHHCMNDNKATYTHGTLDAKRLENGNSAGEHAVGRCERMRRRPRQDQMGARQHVISTRCHAMRACMHLPGGAIDCCTRLHIPQMRDSRQAGRHIGADVWCAS